MMVVVLAAAHIPAEGRFTVAFHAAGAARQVTAWDLDTLERAWSARQPAGDGVLALAAGAGCVWGAVGDGVVMWELRTGSAPRAGEPAAVCAADSEGPPAFKFGSPREQANVP